MVIEAIVLQVNNNSLLVREVGTNNEILVFFPNARRFSRGDCVRITHTGRMTMSIPPQVTAISVQPSQACAPARPPVMPPPIGSRPSEMTAIVLQRRRNGLLVRDLSNNRQLVVTTPHADHFCPGQRIFVTFDVMRLNNPPEIDALNIRAIC